MSRLKVFVRGAICALIVAIVGVGMAGYFVFTNSRVDVVRPVDAIVVLGGEHDGREEYGIELATRGISRNVILSNPHGGRDKKMPRYCATLDPRFTVTCVRPHPSTTRGEAMFTRDLAQRNGWRSILVVSWRFHLPRARYIFSQCFDGRILARDVPRRYDFSLAEWEYTYLYQTVGFAKAVLQGEC
jgi:uncharacterized SAM-binding protein YcdF (DUF218 family)